MLEDEDCCDRRCSNADANTWPAAVATVAVWIALAAIIGITFQACTGRVW